MSASGKNPMRPFKQPFVVVTVTLGIYLFKFLASNIYGFLVVSLMVYGYFLFLSDTQPLTFDQLILWSENLEVDHKIALLSSCLTILGFLIAFQIGSSNAKEEAKITMKLALANEIEAFIDECARLSVKINIYAAALLRLSESIRNRPNAETTLWEARQVVRESVAFFNIRTQLSERSIAIHRLLGRNYTLLSSHWGGIHQLTSCIEAFQEIARDMWFIIPALKEDDADIVTNAGRIIEANREAYERFKATFERNYNFMTGVAGMMRGTLLAAVVETNLPMVITVVRLRKALKEMAEEAEHRIQRVE
jgi:hypothetical protein